MAEFCSCGSIIINSHCSNKNCSLHPVDKSSTAKPASKTSSRKTASAALKASKTAEKPSRVRRASKCITYTLDELEKNRESS